MPREGIKFLIMSRSTSLVAFVASVALGLVSSRATPIGGAINFDGIATTNTGTLSTAGSFTSISNVTVVPGGDGIYASIPTGTPATFTPFNFSAASVMPLWTFSSGGNSYTFTATSITVAGQTSAFLDLDGMGYASVNGVNTPAGTWSITDTHVGDGTVFTFGASSAVPATTPDSGATALLLALGMTGVSLGVIYRRGLPARRSGR
jgi:hypothetical protein